MSSVYNIAFTGFGKSAKNFHLPLIRYNKRFSLYSVMLPKNSTTKVDIPDVNVVRSLKELLKDDKIDVVVITAPNHLHFDQAHDALNADKHVVIEKPMTVTRKEAETLIELAAQKNKQLTVFHNRRWDSDFLTIKKYLDGDRIGEPLELISTFNRYRKKLRPNHWKEHDLPGSGILYDLSPHLIDQVLLLFGNPNRLYADIRNQRKGDTDDWFEIKLYYNEHPDLTITLKAGMLVPDQTPRFILRGTKGTVVIREKDKQEEALAAGKDPNKLYSNAQSPGQAEFYSEKDGEIVMVHDNLVPGNYPEFYNKLYYSIEKNFEPPVSPETAMNSINIIETAVASCKAHQVKNINYQRFTMKKYQSDDD